jgi:ABC-type multidrug transport system fused ATPase/permease subunit
VAVQQLKKEPIAMEILVYLLGFGIIAYCTYFNLYTRQAVDAMKSLFKNYPLKYIAALAAVVAVLFIVAAAGARCPYPFWIIGVLAAAEAVLALTNPQGIYTRLVDWYFDNVSEQAHRFFAILGIILGTLLMTLAK